MNPRVTLMPVMPAMATSMKKYPIFLLSKSCKKKRNEKKVPRVDDRENLRLQELDLERGDFRIEELDERQQLIRQFLLILYFQILRNFLKYQTNAQGIYRYFQVMEFV